MTHIIEYEDCENFEFSHTIAFSTKNGGKRLVAVVKGTDVHFEVAYKKELIATFSLLRTAIDFYNSL